MAVRTGIFFYYQEGERLRDFPQALKGILEKGNVLFYDAFYPSKPPSAFDLDPIPPEILYQVHSIEMVEEVKRMKSFEGALWSATGTVRAAEKVSKGEIDNAFVFTGYGDHHAGTVFFGGGCYFNGTAVAINVLRRNSGAKRFAIVDTDAHHGDGTWEIFGTDQDILYVCFCGNGDWEENNKVNIQVPRGITDEKYLGLLRRGFFPRAKAFNPEILFWNWGYDGTRGEYGDIGLSRDLQVLLAKELREMADEICLGKFIIVLCGGSRRDLACWLIPKVLEILSE